MKKFDQVERWAIGVALETFRVNWKEENTQAEKDGGMSLFTDSYVDMIVDNLLTKVDEGTTKKALKNLEQLKKEGKQ